MLTVVSEGAGTFKVSFSFSDSVPSGSFEFVTKDERTIFEVQKDVNETKVPVLKCHGHGAGSNMPSRLVHKRKKE